MDGLFPKGVRAYWRNAAFAELSDDVIEVLIRRGAEQRWIGTAFDVHHMGGAFGRVPQEATPFPSRAAGYCLNIYGFWTESADDETRIAFVRKMSEDLASYATGGQYINFQGQEVAGHRHLNPRAVFGDAAFRRLVENKRRYDPENPFHVNTNIPQAARIAQPDPVHTTAAALVRTSAHGQGRSGPSRDTARACPPVVGAGCPDAGAHRPYTRS